MTPTSNYLFVYGTLRRGLDNLTARLLHNSSDHLGPARARGHLYQLAGYPGFVASHEEDAWVQGELLHLRHPELTYAQLDKYEGCSPNDPLPHEYRRAILPVLLDCGAATQAWFEASVYLYTLDPTGKPRIHSGDYLSGD